jgi:hypothetical protein
MTRYSVALGLILGLASGTLFTVVRAKGQNTAPGTPVHMVVSVESRHGAEIPKITREDVAVTEGHDRDRVSEWLPAIGEHAGLDLYVLVDDSSFWSVETQLAELRAFIVQQPPSTFIAVGYMHDGTVETARALTQDHASAAKALRLPLGNSAGAASPYFSVEDLIKRWQPIPARPRREIVMITSGIDLYSPAPLILTWKKPSRRHSAPESSFTRSIRRAAVILGTASGGSTGDRTTCRGFRMRPAVRLTTWE